MKTKSGKQRQRPILIDKSNIRHGFILQTNVWKIGKSDRIGYREGKLE